MPICNLAIMTVRFGTRVIVVEADLRRPRATGYFSLPNSIGVTDILTRPLEAAQVIQPWEADAFDVLASGPAPPGPSDLLGSHRLSQLMEQLRERSEQILVDAPPVLPFADAVAAMPACDGVIMVVRYGKTHIAQLRRASDALEATGSPILGSVLSMTPADASPGDCEGATRRRSGVADA